MDPSSNTPRHTLKEDLTRPRACVAPVGQPLTGHTDGVRAVAAVSLPDGRTLLATGSDDATVRLWDPARGTPVRALHIGQPIRSLYPLSPGKIALGLDEGIAALTLPAVPDMD